PLSFCKVPREISCPKKALLGANFEKTLDNSIEFRYNMCVVNTRVTCGILDADTKEEVPL
ncbi:MAG: hypothetical protein IJC29_01140, partial [Clostridia bacterium]|nr:hypothetical protein [Clostridia bacterium]